MSHDALRWWQYIGPWPLRAWVVFWGVGAVNFIAATSSHREEIIDRPLVAIARVVVLAVASTVTVTGVVALGARAYPDRTPRSLPTYVFFILGATGLGSTITFVLSRIVGAVSADEIVYVPLLALRASVWAIFLLAVAGVTVMRLSRQTRRAEEALAQSLEQQELMLISEERSRRQLASLLHDRVQAGLMAACLDLRVSASAGSVDQAEVERIVARIDEIRGLDVRQAARTLSPDLASVDLRTALTELAKQYEPGMVTQIVIDPGLVGMRPDLSDGVLLACYRIAEQGLLNAVVHGRATRVNLTIACGDDVEITLVDNGSGLPDGSIVPGLGSAVIDAWCRVLDGTWRLEAGRESGTVLIASLPLATAERTADGSRVSHL